MKEEDLQVHLGMNHRDMEVAVEAFKHPIIAKTHTGIRVISSCFQRLKVACNRDRPVAAAVVAVAVGAVGVAVAVGAVAVEVGHHPHQGQVVEVPNLRLNLDHTVSVSCVFVVSILWDLRF
jgi:hypothetical protein